ncbi:CRISPR-associated endonuclease Cas1 [Synechococcales cyanobacterium C]|uniref:CRISPR-associated endonuclease Cas1 n=1 Tax=Petrachloros mirabilis ULC683 TaxID=2781853 RepID=A0A8K2A9I7_9CYAN|nr:CRISPR-associated endonuclease Cas1 [Petrachloros mirabilis]NCJ08075.1 CRISPR-associated endonuclease Cas1 [Petrachloros mirabilis ULC683]
MVTAQALWSSWQRVKSGTPIAGVDGITPSLYAPVVEESVVRLEKLLLSRRYTPAPMRGLLLKKQGGTRRLVGIATVCDRIVQRYLLSILAPILDEVLSTRCYAYRTGYSVHHAVAHFALLQQELGFWVVQADIRSFFDRICWAILYHCIEQLPLSELERYWLLQQVSTSVWLQGRLQVRHQGVVQGSVLSGALANLYLAEFDHWAIAAGLSMIRYGDDLAVACGSEAEATEALEVIERQLKRLYLALQPTKTKITPPGQELVLLGHRMREGEVLGTLKDWHPYRPKAKKNKHSERNRALRCAIKQPAQAGAKNRLADYWRPQMTTLYITDQGALLRAQHQQFVVNLAKQELCKVPSHQVSHILLFGCCNVSQGAARLAFKRRIPIIFLSQKGRYFGRMEVMGQAEVEYLMLQAQLSLNTDLNLRIAKAIVLGKVHNSRILLQRLNRRHEATATTEAIRGLEALTEKVCQSQSVEVLWGYEGQAAKVYFQGLASRFMEPFEFGQRSIRPPKNPVNSLLSLGYTLLHESIFSFVLALGLHTHFGHLHKRRKNHPALPMDLTEEFRAPVVDSFVLNLVNSKIIKFDDFLPPDERGGVFLYADALKVFLKHWEDRMNSEVTHPNTGLRVSIRRCMELQVREYLACLTGEQPIYRPMLWSK